MNQRRIYAGPYSEADAYRKARRTCRAYADSIEQPYPIPHTSVVGTPPADLATHPERYATHYLTSPAPTRDGQYMIEVTPEMEALPEAPDVVRTGTEQTDSRWPLRDEPSEIERVDG